MGGSERGGDRQSEAGAGGAAALDLLGAGEAVEQPVHELGWDAGAVIPDPDLGAVADGGAGELNGSGAVLDGVAHVVGEHLLQPQRVRPHDETCGAVDTDVGPGEHSGALGQGVGEVDVGRCDVQFAVVEGGDGEQILDEHVEPAGQSVGTAQHVVDLGRGQPVAAVLQNLDDAGQAGQRGAQLVGDHGDEMIAYGVGFLKFGVALLQLDGGGADPPVQHRHLTQQRAQHHQRGDEGEQAGAVPADGEPGPGEQGQHGVAAGRGDRHERPCLQSACRAAAEPGRRQEQGEQVEADDDRPEALGQDGVVAVADDDRDVVVSGGDQPRDAGDGAEHDDDQGGDDAQPCPGAAGVGCGVPARVPRGHRRADQQR